MSTQHFPVNPSNGMVFQSAPGVFFVYEVQTNSWMKVTGDEIFPLATPLRSGLMEASDLQKINRIVVPSPNSTIKAEGCSSKFVAGYISLFGDDDFVTITTKPLLTNSGLTGGNYPFRITKNTAGIDFKIDKNALFEALISRGQMNVAGVAGAPGEKGKKGPNGRTFATGPKGPKGIPGTAPPCSISITPDTIPLETQPGLNKAVVAIRTEELGNNQFDLVVTLGVVGNPDASPSRVNVQGEESTWILAITTNAGIDQPLYYVDVTGIVNAIEAKFKTEIDRIRAGHEAVVQSWLSQMANLFSQQKAALCCALTLCEGQKVQEREDEIADANEAAANNTLSIVEAIQDIEACSSGTSGALIGPLNIPTEGSEGVAVAATDTLTIDGIRNSGTIKNASSVVLGAGAYTVEIAECCIKSGKEYVANVTISYFNRGRQQTTSFVKPGTYKNEGLAKRGYTNLAVEIEHDGGEVYGFLPSNLSQELDGAVMLRFRRKEEPEVPVVVAPPDNLTCMISAGRLAQYESAWENGKCWGLVTRIGGQDYIIVRKVEDTEDECSKLVVDQSGGFSIAWPTFDGKTFIKLGNLDSFPFKADAKLNELVRYNLQNNAFSAPRGDFSGETSSAMIGGVWSSSNHQMILAQFGLVIFPIL